MILFDCHLSQNKISVKCQLSVANTQKYLCQASKAHTDQMITLDSNPPGGRAVFTAAGVDDWLVVIETAKGKSLPDGLSLIPLGLHKHRKMNKNSISKSAAPSLSSLLD